MSPFEPIRRVIRPLIHEVRLRRSFETSCAAFENDNIPPPVLYDIGARWGVSPPYDRLKRIPGFQSIGFEPDLEEAARLVAARQFTQVCPVALGDSAERRTLYLAEDPGCSSLFPPNMEEIARHTVSRQFRTVSTCEVDVCPLDDVISRQNLPNPDYIKVDCEGAEDIIFEGGRKSLKEVIGVTFEARLHEFYRGGATLTPLLDRFTKLGFVCLRMDPIGSFFESLEMFDVVMLRHPSTYSTKREEQLAIVFSLLHGKWLFAQRIQEILKTQTTGLDSPPTE